MGGSDALSHFNNGTTLKNQGAVRLAHTASYRHTKHLQLPTKAITYSTIKTIIPYMYIQGNLCT